CWYRAALRNGRRNPRLRRRGIERDTSEHRPLRIPAILHLGTDRRACDSSGPPNAKGGRVPRPPKIGRTPASNGRRRARVHVSGRAGSRAFLPAGRGNRVRRLPPCDLSYDILPTVLTQGIEIVGRSLLNDFTRDS